MTDAPTDGQRTALYMLASGLHQSWQDQHSRDPGTREAGKAETSRVLARIAEFMDENPTVRLDDSQDPGGEDEDTHPLALALAISTDPASVPLYKKMVERQPDILTKKFLERTLDYHMADVVDFSKERRDRAAVEVLQQKLNPGRPQMAKMDRLFGKVDNERGTNPLPRGVQTIIRSQLTGIPTGEQIASKTKMGGRKTRRRKARKTKRPTRKTK